MSIPIKLNHKLGKGEESNPIYIQIYHHVVEKLTYIFHTTLYIFYSGGVLTQFMHDLREAHLMAESILKYLKGTLSRDIFFKKNKNIDIEVYIDVDYGGSIFERPSTLS